MKFAEARGLIANPTLSWAPPQISPASANTGRSLYVGRSHPSGSGQQQQGQPTQQGHQGQRTGPQRSHRSKDLSGAGGENSWGALASLLQQQQRKQQRQGQQQEEGGGEEEEDEVHELEQEQEKEMERQGQERERRREQHEQHLSRTTRSTVTSRGFGNWDGRGGIGVGAPDIMMRSIHEGHFSPEH